MAKESGGRLIGDGEDTTIRTVNPTDLASDAISGSDTGASGSAPRNVGSGDDLARDDDGNVKRNKDGSVARKRGRKAGSSNGGAAKKTSASSVKGIEKLLMSAHMMAAAFLKSPEIILDDQEAAMLAMSLQGVQDFYSFETSAEVLLWMGVAGTLATVYGPRIMSIGMRSKKEKANKPKPPQEAAPLNPGFVEGILVPHHAPTE